jgi:hypothetical protein
MSKKTQRSAAANPQKPATVRAFSRGATAGARREPRESAGRRDVHPKNLA